MRSPVCVGRDAELAILTTAMRRAASGEGAWIDVVGEAGVGKSRLVAEIAAADDDRIVTATGRTSPLDRSTPYRPISEALLSLTRDVARPEGELGPYAAALARIVPAWRRDGDAHIDAPAIIGESVLRVLDHLAGDGAIVVVLEDLHWADDATLGVCAYLADHAAGFRTLVLATRRPEELAAGWTVPATMRIDVRPLDAAAVGRLAEACLGEAPSAEQLDALVARSGGLPLLVEDLLDTSDPVHSRYADLVATRLAQLDAEDRLVLVAASMLGDRIDWATLTSTGIASEADIAGALHRAAAVGLIETRGADMRFRHALTHEVILSSNTPTVAALTANVAAALEARGDLAGLAQAADLWERSGNSEQARHLHERAAAVALVHDFPARALDATRRAASLATGDDRIRLEVELLNLLVRLGHVDEARDLGLGLSDHVVSEPLRQAAVSLALARVELAAGHADAAARHLATTGDGPESQLLRARLALLAGVGDRRTLAHHLARQVVASTITTRPELACEALGVAALCARTRSLAEATVELERALRVAEEHRLTTWRLRLLNELGTIEMLAHATGDRLERARTAALRAGALDVAAATLTNTAALHAMRGELDQAHRVASLAADEATRLGLASVAAAAHLIDGVSHGFAGDEAAMERSLCAATELAPHDADLDSFAWGAGRGLCALVREDRNRAIAALRNGVRDDAPIGSLDTSRGPLALVLAVSSAGHARDELDQARAVATPGAGWSDLWLGAAEAVVAGALHPEVAAARFDAAERAGRRHPLFRAIALRLVAEAALRDGWGDPITWLRDAEATFVAGRQDRIASACRTLLARAGATAPRRRGRDRALPRPLLEAGVTAREADVLELVAERLTNKEIATRLYLSARTVEKHVASLLAKLGASDRTELANRARAFER